MHRTQIYFNEQEWGLLKLLASRKHSSVSELIRKAVKKVYFLKKRMDLKISLNHIAGMWADRDFKTSDYIRDLRKSRRAK